MSTTSRLSTSTLATADRPYLLIAGAQGTGKKLAFEVIRRCPSIAPGAVVFESAPLRSDLATADRYIVTSRTLAAESLLRRDVVRFGLPGVTWREVVDRVRVGSEQVEAHVAGADVFRIEYRSMVEETAGTIKALAGWLDVEPWPIDFEVYDADEGLGRCR